MLQALRRHLRGKLLSVWDALKQHQSAFSRVRRIRPAIVQASQFRPLTLGVPVL
jgi:hypothetical protein